MSLLPSPTPPPSVNWVAAYWADDPKARQHPNNPLVRTDSIKPVSGNLVQTTTSASPPYLVTNDPTMGGRNAWVYSPVSHSASYRPTGLASGGVTTVVMVGYFPVDQTSGTGWGPALGDTGMWVYSGGNKARGLAANSGNNQQYTNVRPPTSMCLIRMKIDNSPGITWHYLWLNGTGPLAPTGGYLNPGSRSTTNYGTAALASAIGRYGFVGYFNGDVTTDPEWSNFLTWVQSHYGFDPTAAYYSASDPPPISWEAEYLADDFDTTTGTWPDRTGRGYTLSLPSGAVSNMPGIVARSGNTPAGWKEGYDSGAVGKTPQITPAPALCAAGSRDLEFIARITTVGNGFAVASVCGGFMGSRQWEWQAAAGSLSFGWNDVTAGNGVATSVTFPADLLYKPIWLRLTQVISGGQTTHTYYVNTGDTTTVPTTWTQIGTPQTVAYAANFVNGGQPLNFGATGPWGLPYNPGQVLHRFIVNNGVGGSAIVDADFSAQTPGTTTSFVDGAGNTVTLAQTQPIKVTNVVNGQPVVRFDGVNDYMTNGPVLAAPFSGVVICRWRSVPVADTCILSHGNGVVFSLGAQAGTSTQVRAGANPNWATVTVPSGDLTGWHMYRVFWDTGTATLRCDEGTPASASAAFSTWAFLGHINTFGTPVGAGTGGNIDIAYVGLFSGDVSTSALWPAFKTWVTSKYGITLA